MPYEKELDKTIWSKKTQIGNSIIEVKVMSYNNGRPKVQIQRKTMDEDNNERWAKLGRLTKEETKAILPLLEEAIGEMEE